jgi:hypothetical protein
MKDPVQRMKRKATHLQTIFVSYLFNKGLVSRTLKNSQNPMSKSEKKKLN